MDIPQLGSYIKENPVILVAADSGMEACIEMGIRPKAVIGDFDSAKTEALSYIEKWEKDGTKIIRLNPIKDDTDTESAIRFCVKELGVKTITIFGATGTRLDHVFGNISLLGIGEKENIKITLIDKNNRISLKTKSFIIKKEEQFGKYISLFPLGGPVEGLTLKGFFYTLLNHTLTGDTSLCVSNEITDSEATVEFSSGKLLLIESRD